LIIISIYKGQSSHYIPTWQKMEQDILLRDGKNERQGRASIK